MLILQGCRPAPAEMEETPVMWPFSRKTPAPPWYEEELQRVHVQVNATTQRQNALEHAVSTWAEGIATAKTIEKRVGAVESALRQFSNEVAGNFERYHATVEQIRGLATGGRGGRPRNEDREADRQALDLGRQVLQRVQTPEGRAQLILELQNADSSTVAPNGQVKWTPPSGNGSPV